MRNRSRAARTFLISKCRTNGLIGEPVADIRYTYGHGFSMLFLSQVLGEEGYEDRRTELLDVLNRAVDFCAKAQTPSGGWGYMSAKDGANYDEGSTTITQVQGLRGCRNAGISVPAEVIEHAIKYIYDCKNEDGGISYSSKQMGTSRPAITAAALAALFNAGDYDSKHVPQMLKYTRETLHGLEDEGAAFGHWHLPTSTTARSFIVKAMKSGCRSVTDCTNASYRNSRAMVHGAARLPMCISRLAI